MKKENSWKKWWKKLSVALAVAMLAELWLPALEAKASEVPEAGTEAAAEALSPEDAVPADTVQEDAVQEDVASEDSAQKEQEKQAGKPAPVKIRTTAANPVPVKKAEAAGNEAAEKGYAITEEADGSLTCTYDAAPQKNVYLLVLKETAEDGTISRTVVAPGNERATEADVYYFDDSGKGKLYEGAAVVTVTYEKTTGNYYVKSGKLKKTGKAYYAVYKSYLYQVTETGKAAVYIKDKKKKGTYKKVVSSVCYKVEYKTGKASKYTGVYSGKYYKSGKLGTGWYKSGSKKYYYKNGTKYVSGWKTISKKKYYFDKSGVLQVNKIVGSKKKGYYYVDKSGVQITAKEIKQAVSFVVKHGKGSTRAKKLRSCYNYLWGHYPYKRTHEKAPGASKMPKLARDMFTNKRGNCYRYAAAFAYIAKVLGYDSRVASGMVGARGGGMTPHAWTEIKDGKSWYQYDCNMQRTYPRISFYRRTNRNYPVRHRASKRFTISVSGGKVKWK